MWRTQLVVVLTAACGFSPGPPQGNPLDASPDGDASTDGVPLGPWGTPVLVREVTTSASEDDPALTADLLELYFASTRGSSEDIYVARRASPTAPFGPPERVSVSSDRLDSNVDISADGLVLTFTSTTGGSADIFIATRPNRTTGWSSPSRIPSLSSGASEWGAVLSADGLQAVLCSDRDGDEALYAASRTALDQGFVPPRRIPELDSPADDCDAMSADGEMLYFTRNPTAGSNDLDLYRARRQGLRYVEVTRIDELSLPNVRDSDPWVSADQRTMYFSSNRGGGSDDLYMATR